MLVLDRRRYLEVKEKAEKLLNRLSSPSVVGLSSVVAASVAVLCPCSLVLTD